MFEHKTFATILQEMLDTVPDDIDKREGSIIYDALAPTAMEMAEVYSNLDVILRITFADTSDGDFLERRVSEHGVKRYKATAAIRKGVFTDTNGAPLDIPLGRRFRINDTVYALQERLEVGQFKLIAETVGEEGNQDFGPMIPVEPVNRLGTAILTDVLIPGENEESDESLYAKYLDHINEVAFGGNRADYKQKIMKIQGVGGVRLTRTPSGGGTVGATIIDSNDNVPSSELITLVQNTIDPLALKGDGYGTAPIGHTVLVSGVEDTLINFSHQLTLVDVTLGQVEPLVNEVIDEYLAELRKTWKDNKPIVIRVSNIESRILNIEGIQDISGTTLNGLAENITLLHEIPIKGSVVISE